MVGGNISVDLFLPAFVRSAEHIINIIHYMRKKVYSFLYDYNKDTKKQQKLQGKNIICFPGNLEKLCDVLELFVQAYNDFGAAKMNFRQNRCSFLGS